MSVGIEALGFNVIGPVSGNLGLGVLARNLLDSLAARGINFRVFDTDPEQGRRGYEPRFADHYVNEIEGLPYPVNFFVIPPAGLPGIVCYRFARLLARENCLNVAFPMWELTALPDLSRHALEVFDVIVAGSDFGYHGFSFHLSGVTVIAGLPPLFLPDTIAADRQRFALPKDKVIFVTSFEAASDPQRKNPLAVLEAFRRARTKTSDIYLLVKVNNAIRDGAPQPFVRQLIQETEGDGSIKILTEVYTYPEVLSLYASCDVLVSLHRSEGLGLPLMEAMALGKPVIATGWSGNMSFMDHRSACLVNYNLVPVQGTIAEYSGWVDKARPVWAEPDLDQAVAWILRLAGNSGLRNQVGDRARERIAAFRERAVKAEFVDELQAIWDAGPDFRKTRTERDARLNALRQELQLAGLPEWRRVLRKARWKFDAHLLWRLRQRT